MESLRGLSSSPASAYDELVTGQKSIRYHWQGILSVIRSLPNGLGERVESARRQLEESGATVNLLDDRGAARWTFDPLPMVIAPDEWAGIEAGLIQRAKLLDGVLADVYGPQTLLKQQLLPPMLVHANRHFPAAGPGHRRRRAEPIPRQLCGRPGATEQRPLARPGRPYRASGGRGLRPRNAARAGAQPAGGVPLHPRPPSPALRRPLAGVAALDGAGCRSRSPTWRC
jgi:hypothetical protein